MLKCKRVKREQIIMYIINKFVMTDSYIKYLNACDENDINKENIFAILHKMQHNANFHIPFLSL